MILALTPQPRSEQAWKKGSIGERALGSSLETLRGEGYGVLHDRRISPGTKSNIDHLVIGPAGVFVVDAKRYTGKIERRDRGFLFRRDWRLYVNGRDETRLIEGMTKQVDAVRAALQTSSAPDCPVIPALCFLGSERGLAASPFVIGPVRVHWPRSLGKMLRSAGSLSARQIAVLERELAAALPAA